MLDALARDVAALAREGQGDTLYARQVLQRLRRSRSCCAAPRLRQAMAARILRWRGGAPEGIASKGGLALATALTSSSDRRYLSHLVASQFRGLASLGDLLG